ncbi:MAG: CBS domain-containing protein [Deltaproteobacteria bacterium]|nr:CBS domain-containing protein [Deltaproteobacteria bacterium]
MKDILIALEPNYGKLEGMGVLSRSGYSPDLIKSMLEDNALWLEPFQFVCERACQLKVSDFVKPTEDSEYVDEKATLAEAIHQLVVYPHQSLLVTRDKKVVGILRLTDVFTKICDKIKTCEI